MQQDPKSSLLLNNHCVEGCVHSKENIIKKLITNIVMAMMFVPANAYPCVLQF